MRDEVGAALSATGGDGELAFGPVECAHHGHLLGLARRRHAQVRATLGPGAGKIGMCQGFALIAEQEHDVACVGLHLAQLEPQTNTIDWRRGPDALSVCAAAGASGTPFFARHLGELRSGDCDPLAACDLLGKAGQRPVCSVRDRGREKRRGDFERGRGLYRRRPLGNSRLAGADPRHAWKSLRHSRIVSSRTPKASAIRLLVQAPSVNRMARARLASARSASPAMALSAAL
jgi:hypothetical protein